jgi:DNA recombination protein Rad52
VAALAAPLDRANVRTRSQSGQNLSYIEGWVAIAEANRIFGFDGWQRETLELRCVAQTERLIGRDRKDGWGVTYIARIRIRVGTVLRDGCGAGHGIDVDLGLAHESAIKEAETDAMKRALMTFGNPFGLALYDKEQRQVTGGSGNSAGASPRRAPRPAGRGPGPVTRTTTPAPVRGPAPGTQTNIAPLMDRDQLASQALSVIKNSGLTATGMRHLLDELGGPAVTGIGQLADDTLGRIVRVGLSPETVARWNAEPESVPVADDERPMHWEGS